MATTGNPVNRLIWLLSKSAHTPITLEVAACVEALAKWAFENVVGHDCLPKALPTEFSSILSRLGEANAKHLSIVAEADEAENSMLLKGLGVTALGFEPVLTIEEFYLFRARGLMNFPGDPEYAAYLEQHPTRQRE